MGFKEPGKAREELLQLATGTEERPFTLHVRMQFAEICPFMLNALSFTAYPDAALMRLAQILSRLSAPATLYELLKMNPVLCHFLVTLVANSEYLASILLRDPGLLETLSNVDVLDRASTREELDRDLESLQHAFDTQAALYRLRDGEMLRVAVRELSRNITVAQVGDELTLLAEVILCDALRQAREKVTARYGPAGMSFAILGLGKLGGLEMGYGSDLDLVFVYEADRELECGMSPTEYFAAVASHMLKGLKEPTRYGVLYDIDARLRPDGNKGVLAVSESRLPQYYFEDAQPWERMALMKVRVVAGDPEFAAKIDAMARDFRCPWTASPSSTMRRSGERRPSRPLPLI
jgi:glutamate-ammonia-ligase adenylyltransferase